jgi:hypothetical protein
MNRSGGGENWKEMEQAFKMMIMMMMMMMIDE